jgi:hypothetical protein
MIDVSELIIDPDFAQPYLVHRMSGYWFEGEFIQEESSLQFYGVITPANTQDVNMLPEGDRIAGLMTFYTTADNPIFVTRNLDTDKGTSDQIEWRGEHYRIMQTYPYNDYGYVKAIGTRMAGD